MIPFFLFIMKKFVNPIAPDKFYAVIVVISALAPLGN